MFDVIQTKKDADLQDMATSLPDPAITRCGNFIFPANVFQILPLTQSTEILTW